MEFHDIPQRDQEDIKRRLIQQIEGMNAAELTIVKKTEASLALYIGEAIKAIAALLGYIIAVPVAWVRMAAEGFRDGFERGLQLGM